MARTNRSARKSTGGRVPRGQLAPRNPPPQEEPVEDVPQEEVPEEEAPQDQPQEVEMIPADSDNEVPSEEEYTPESDSEEEPIYRKAEKFRTYGEEAPRAAGRLKGLLYCVGITKAPEYHVKRVPRPGRDEFRAEVTVYDGPRVVSKHAGPTFRSTCAAAVSDAAWEAMTVLSHTFRRFLAGTGYSYIPRRRSGSRRYTGGALGPGVPQVAVMHCQDIAVAQSDRITALQGEIRTLRDRLATTEASYRARLRVQDGEASDLYTSDRETWTATSPDHTPEEHPPVESHPTGRTPSPSGSRTR